MGSILKNTMHELHPGLIIVYYCTFFCIVRFFLWWLGLLIRFCFLWKLSMESFAYIGFVDCASRHTQHSSSIAWVIYTPMGQVLSSWGICLQPSSNNVAKYSVVIELLRDAISHGVLSLEVCLDSQLILPQLNGLYHVRDPTLLRIFLRVRLLEWKFDNITYMFQEFIIKLLTHMLTMR